MASSNSLLNLIRDFSTEKSQGERKIVNLKREIVELQSELDSVNLELEEAKRLKEFTEQELKGYEVVLAMNEFSIQALEGRISLIQCDISTVGSDLDALKNEEGALRDDFINKMFELNAKIRKFQQSVDIANCEAFSSDIISQDVEMVYADTKEVEESKSDLEHKLAEIISETNEEEDKFRSEQNLYMQEKKELEDLNHRISLMEAVMTASKELQELAIYPHYNFFFFKLIEYTFCLFMQQSVTVTVAVSTEKVGQRLTPDLLSTQRTRMPSCPSLVFSLIGSTQTTRLEEGYASVGGKLQASCICPSCHCDNVEMLGGILQKSEGI